MVETHTAAVLENVGQPLVLKSIPIPKAKTGSAIIRILATALSPNTKANLTTGFGLAPLRTPVVPGFAAIGRVHSVGPDATRLRPGQLIWYDFFVQSRDNPEDKISAGFMGGNQQLEETWSNNSFAEYAEVPLERIWTLNEDILCRVKGYSFADLAYLAAVSIPMAGLLDMGVRSGDIVIVAPATGTYGGSAVPAALSLGAKVIACGRNAKTLARMTDTFGVSGRFVTVTMTGEVSEDTAAIRAAAGSRGADYFIDFIPPRAVGTTHILSCLGALRDGGRASFMGAIFSNIEIPYFLVMLKNIRIEGRFMFDRGHGEQTVKLLEAGHLVVGNRPMCGTKMHRFKLKDIHQAVEAAVECSGWGNLVVVEP